MKKNKIEITMTICDKTQSAIKVIYETDEQTLPLDFFQQIVESHGVSIKIEMPKKGGGFEEENA